MKMPYEDWECFKAGMYRTECENWQDVQGQCVELLSSDELIETMLHITVAWPVSTKHYFTKSAGTWVPWLGHASCCFELGAPNWVTKKAWHDLSRDQQAQANMAAASAHENYMDRLGVKNDGQGVLI
jgi:hypothetical protein